MKQHLVRSLKLFLSDLKSRWSSGIEGDERGSREGREENEEEGGRREEGGKTLTAKILFLGCKNQFKGINGSKPCCDAYCSKNFLR